MHLVGFFFMNCSVMCCSFLLMNINFKVTRNYYFDTTIFLKNPPPQYLFCLINCWSWVLPRHQATPWRWGQSQSLNRQKTSTSWRGCLPKNISLNSVAAKASRLISCVMIRIGSCPVACMLCLVYLKYTTRLQSRNVSFSNIDISSLVMAVKPTHVGTNEEWNTL